jgi:hypothetical protein
MSDDLYDESQVIQGLEKLTVALSTLNDKENPPHLSHYRRPPDAASESYTLIQEGARIVHGTSTKYTLMGKIDRNAQRQIATELLKGCQLIATGCLVLHEDSTGCGRSVRHSSKQAVRAIIQTALNLAISFADGSALEENVGAQKTGAVWQTCDSVQKLPIG